VVSNLDPWKLANVFISLEVNCGPLSFMKTEGIPCRKNGLENSYDYCQCSRDHLDDFSVAGQIIHYDKVCTYGHALK